MARARETGDSKQGLIIALVIFVILTLTLGVVAYLGYSDQGTIEAKWKEADTKKGVAEKEREKLDFERLVYKHAIGIADKEDSNKLAGVRGQFQADFPAMAKGLTGVNWQPSEAAPQANSTYLAMAAKLRNDYDNSQKQLAAANDDLKKAHTTFADDLKLKNEELQRTKQALADESKKTAMAQQAKTKEYEDLFAKVRERDDEIENLKRQVATLTDTNKKALEKLQGEINSLKTAVVKAEEQVKKVDLTELDLPKGKIVHVERTGTTAYVNLGTADNLKPGITFSIFEPGIDGKKKYKEPKGSLEIVGPAKGSDRLSLAKITESRDATHDPILKGDLIYNPAWSPNMREHVAIIGLIDLMGDGKDNTAELVRNLTKQGIIVDAYLDLKDKTLKNGEGGPGKLTRTTSYLVRGESPQFGDSYREGNVIDERKMDVNVKLAELEKEAENLGITKIPVRRFLALIGYKVPPGAFSGDSSTFYLRQTRGIGGGKDKEEPKKDKEPKDDSDEPKKPAKKEPPKKDAPKKDAPKKDDKEAPKEDKGG